MNKTCTKCGVNKPVSEFYKFCRSKDGLAYECKECSKSRAKNYAKEHRDERTKKHLEWADKNREHLRDYMRNYMREYSRGFKRKEHVPDNNSELQGRNSHKDNSVETTNN